VTSKYASMQVCMYVCIYLYLCKCACVNACKYVCICTCTIKWFIFHLDEILFLQDALCKSACMYVW
jgi:hypothetical protein